MSKCTVVSLFAGIGGICQGFKQSGFDIIFANEIDKNACITYRLNHETTELIEGDVNNLHVNIIPDSDILTAGFPCQSFSIAGYRKGFEDSRGNLFFSIIKILKDKINKPRILFLENVKNLITHGNGRTLEIILSELKTLGYKIHYKVMNSAEYGNLPQNRERIFIIGFLNENEFKTFSFPNKLLLEKRIESCLEDNIDDIYYYTHESKYYQQLIEIVKNKNTVYQIRRGLYIRENKNQLCPTLTANMGMGGHNVPIVIDNNGIRKLTPRECFNFQGFPSSFKLPRIANMHLYKQAGNSVTIPLIEKIANNILLAIS